MGRADIMTRTYLVKVIDPSDGQESLLICEVERSKLELKQFNVWSYCGYPDEIEDISERMDGKMRSQLRRHTMQLMSDENLWDDDEGPPPGSGDVGEIGV